MLKKLIGAAAILCSVVAGEVSAAAFYNPFGPQQNVGLATITNGGWTQCYSSTMSTFIGSSAQNVLSQCNGNYLMMAGRLTGQDTFLLLAETTIADATFNTDSGTSNTHLSNGTNWYFGSDWSWGFAGANESVSLDQCDTLSGDDRMCLHTVNGAGGYRIGNVFNLNVSTNYEKVFFVSNGLTNDVPEPATLGLLGIGLAAAALRRKARKA
jgi:hypothetical protein